MKQRHLLLAVGVVIAGLLALFGDKTSDNGIAAPVTRASPTTKQLQAAPSPAVSSTSTVSTVSTTAKTKDEREEMILALQARTELIDEVKENKSADILFTGHNWNPPPPPPPPISRVPLPPPPPPVAPPVPFTYIGKKIEDALWEVYLSRGEQTYIVREAETLADVYKITSIKPPIMTLTYIPLNQTQTINIGGTD